MAITGIELSARKNKETLDFHGISKWHEMGFTGKGINYLVIDLDEGHSSDVRCQFSRVSPDSMVMESQIRSTIEDGELKSCDIVTRQGERLDLQEFVKKYDIHIIGQSVGGKTRSPLIDAYLKETGCVLIGSAGNGGRRGTSGIMRNVGILASAIYLFDGEIKREIYSAIGDDYLDFSVLHGALHGTSFAQPTLSGMVALIMSRYGIMTQEAIYDLFKTICIDTGEPGFDTRLGWGVPILPEEMELEEEMKHTLELWLDKHTYKIDGVSKNTDVAPTIINGRTMTPARLVAEAMGGTVGWVADERKVTVEWEDTLPEK